MLSARFVVFIRLDIGYALFAPMAKNGAFPLFQFLFVFLPDTIQAVALYP